MRRIIAGIGLVAMTASSIVVQQSVAFAGDATGCTPYTEAQLASASIRRGDIPKRFSSNPKRDASFVGCGQTGRYEVCVDENGRKIFGVRPGKHMNVSFTLMSQGSGDNITETEAASSDIYSYRGAAAANRAWKRLKQRIRSCAPTVQTERVFDGIPLDVNVTQKVRTVATAKGFPGFRNAQTVAVDLGSGPQELEIYVDGLSSYRRSGSTIVRTQFAHYNQTSLASVRLSPSQRVWSTREAVTIAARVAALK